MMNFVRIKWRPKWDKPRHELLNAILNDASLTWAAKGLGAYLTTQREGVRFPNSIWDGTMDALQNLADYGYINVVQIKDEPQEA